MKILLTGSSGFIGRNFKKKYAEKYSFKTLDISQKDSEDIRKACFDPSIDIVIHLAGYAGVRKSHEIPEEFWSMNVEGSQRIFDEYGGSVPVIYASSSSIYEWWLSPYATSKKVVETIAPGHTLGLRFHTVYGDDSRPDMLYDKMLKKEVSYITNHKRDWTHVEDVCSAIDICIENFLTLTDKRAIDVGKGFPVSVKEMADAVWPSNNLPIKEVSGEREITCANPKELLSLGWKPEHDILNRKFL